jgi:hypothetical protein
LTAPTKRGHCSSSDSSEEEEEDDDDEEDEEEDEEGEEGYEEEDEEEDVGYTEDDIFQIFSHLETIHNLSNVLIGVLEERYPPFSFSNYKL